jgi:hypothetical protein
MQVSDAILSSSQGSRSMKVGCVRVLFLSIALAIPTLAMGAAMSTSDYSAAKERAAIEYEASRAQCSQLSRNARAMCLVEARAVERKAMARAEARYRNTETARRDARIVLAEADFDVAKAKCDAKAANDRDMCIKEAKAVEVRTKAEAIADEKVAAVRRDMSDDDRNAEYDAAIGKCEALAGQPKEQCLADAKARYRK